MNQELIPHLFRTEFRKIATVLCKHFGIDHIETAEDIASDTFLTAIDAWSYKGVPDNPTAWLYAVARHKATNFRIRAKSFQDRVLPAFATEPGYQPDIDLSDTNIQDSQLQMLFAICHPSIPVESQIGLALRILCGFGIDEIANAFLSNKETISKRLFRAKEKLRIEQVRIELPSEQAIDKRLQTVLTTLYLLFNEGYYSESKDTVLREDLCDEAMRLTQLLTNHKRTNLPAVNALLALMCFHSSRFPARKNAQGELILYQDQDDSQCDYPLISKGAYYLQQASQGPTLSRYHLEASIAYWHTIKADTAEKWEAILQLYNRLLQISYSPIAALNRTYALSKANGKEEAIREAEKLQLTTNPYYFTLLGELYKDIDPEKARANFEQALPLAKTQADRHLITQKLLTLNENCL